MTNDPEDGHLHSAERTQNHLKPLTLEEAGAMNFYGITAAEWRAIKRDVVRGAERFWARRGMVEPDGGSWRGNWKVNAKEQEGDDKL
jgi:hypothetical protein